MARPHALTAHYEALVDYLRPGRSAGDVVEWAHPRGVGTGNRQHTSYVRHFLDRGVQAGVFRELGELSTTGALRYGPTSKASDPAALAAFLGPAEAARRGLVTIASQPAPGPAQAPGAPAGHQPPQALPPGPQPASGPVPGAVPFFGATFDDTGMHVAWEHLPRLMALIHAALLNRGQ